MTTDFWIDGEPVSCIPVTDRGLAYGDGLFETVRVVNRRLTLAELHWQRLEDSLNRLGIAVDIELLMSEVAAFLSLQSAPDGVLKVLITRGSGGRGYNPAGCSGARRILSFHALPEHPESNRYAGITLYPCSTRLGHNSLGYNSLSGMKHLNRLENVLARAEWGGTEFQEGLMLDLDGLLVEGTMSNLFLVKNDTLYTPALDRCGVSGVCREFIMRQASGWGVSVIVQDLDESALPDADEVFVCNSVNGVWPVVRYRHTSWQVGVVTATVRDRVLEVLNG
ncbi:aminodeoxychorismate lyase [Endozoicomonas gorgoniicola]|uniref:Aminodeoxychorismate lyase n=1 Tax=Endozoicomonas gorgoniicola TaxID=1234144 RepID=A0ABT3MVK8_9GAMM|nr:aminodeoxychorismate lyase [Endozoicomonas gorgoniicola]MCW7553399.1 aminodeoxychorismate lyase [Endozoicomonas gorgoniicola]